MIMNTTDKKLRMPNYLLLIFCVAVIFLSLDASTSIAADPSKDIITQIQLKFESKGLEYGKILQGYAIGLFKLFFLVGVAVFGVQAALGRAEIADVIKEFTTMLLFAAFCYVAIIHYNEWTQWILNKQEDMAVAAGGSTLTLKPIDHGLLIFAKAIEPIKWHQVALYLSFFIIGTLILSCLCLITARMLIVLCESYIAMNVAVLMLGFGGAFFMKDYAINVMRYVVSLAVKLLVMQLIVGVGLSFMEEMTMVENVTIENFIVLFVCSLILLVLVQTIPDTVAGIINGSHVGGGVGLKAATGAALGAMAATYTVASKGVGGVGSMGATVSRAAKIASLQGYGGVSGTASQLWKSYQEARQDEKRAGVGPSSIGEMRRMDASIKDMYTATRSASDPNYSGNEYSRNRFSGNPYGSNTAAGAQQGQQPDQSAQASAPFGATAGQAQAAADARSSGPHGAAPGNTPGADRDTQSSKSNATSDAALNQQKKNSQTDGGR